MLPAVLRFASLTVLPLHVARGVGLTLFMVSILQGQSLSGASFTSLRQLQHSDAYIKAYRIMKRLSPSSGQRKRSGNAPSKKPYRSAMIPGARTSQIRQQVHTADKEYASSLRTPHEQITEPGWPGPGGTAARSNRSCLSYSNTPGEAALALWR